MYVINPFIIHNSSNGEIALQHRCGIVVISDSKIRNVIPYLEKNIGEKLLESDLILVFKSKYSQYLKFFIEHNIIKKVEPPNFNIDNIHFFSNSKSISELVSRSLEGTKLFFNHENISSFNNMIQNNSKSVFIVFLNPYDRFLARKLKSLFAINKKTLSVFVYTYYGCL